MILVTETQVEGTIRWDAVMDGDKAVNIRNIVALRREMSRHPELYDTDRVYCLIRPSRAVRLERTTVTQVVDV